MKPKPVVILQHEVEDPPGLIGTALSKLGIAYEVRRLYQGDAMPSWPDDLSALIALGGSFHVHQVKDFPFVKAEKDLMRRMLHQGAPLWGISLGAEILTEAAGGQVYKRRKPEFGWVSVEKRVDDPLLRGVSSPFAVFTWHRYSCDLPPTAHLVAKSDGDDGVQIYRAGGRAWATQFRPEVDRAILCHWMDEARMQSDEPGLSERLLTGSEQYLDSYPEFCRMLVENFVAASGLLNDDV